MVFWDVLGLKVRVAVGPALGGAQDITIYLSLQ